ncbi:cbb3-type cytochrome c oxidase subunit I [bacterium]|nr:cbb3-type cytochrome c oxidase subunit I [bacterium]
MPSLSVWFIRAALLYFVAGFSIGALMLVNKGIPLSPLIWRLLPVHIEWLFIGWMLNLVFGVAYWILPRHGIEPVRGRLWLVWTIFLLLNTGVLTICSSEIFLWENTFILIGRLMEIGSAVGFAVHAWPRIHPFG